MEIKIDPATLPADGQGVRYQTQDEEWHDGYFIEGENMFWVNDSKWHFAWHVLQWENTDPEHIVESRGKKQDNSLVAENLWQTLCYVKQALDSGAPIDKEYIAKVLADNRPEEKEGV